MFELYARSWVFCIQCEWDAIYLWRPTPRVKFVVKKNGLIARFNRFIDINLKINTNGFNFPYFWIFLILLFYICLSRIIFLF